MAQVLHCTITRFVNPVDNENVCEETKALLSAVFKALQVGSVNMHNARCSTQDVAQIISTRLFQPFGLGDKTADLLAHIREHDLTMEVCKGMKTFGINFKIEMAGELYG